MLSENLPCMLFLQDLMLNLDIYTTDVLFSVNALSFFSKVRGLDCLISNCEIREPHSLPVSLHYFINENNQF